MITNEEISHWFRDGIIADIIHTNDLDTLPAGYLAARMMGAKVLYDAHELWSEAGAGGIQHPDPALARLALVALAIEPFQRIKLIGETVP